MFAVFACSASGADSVYSVHEFEHEAEFVCNEMNIAASDFPNPADYRVAPATLEEAHAFERSAGFAPGTFFG
jgi:hypothetical protein